MIEQHVAVFVQDSTLLPTGMNEFDELVEKPSVFQGKLAVMFMNIEHAALCTSRRRWFPFEHRRSDPVDVEDTRQCQPAQPAAYDCDWSMHVYFFLPEAGKEFGTTFHG